jgi:hypothetical protein
MKKILSFVVLTFLILPVLTANCYEANKIKISPKVVNKDYDQDYNFKPRCFGRTFMVEMRDGVKLATDVYRPILRFKPHGTILFRTPYNKDNLAIIGIILSLFGWPTVIQDMRGRYASEGNDTVFQNAHTDGPDTLSWIANQSWSNGKIATIGPSELGITQYFMAGANPANLACQFIQVATPNLHKHAIFQGGQFRESLVAGWLKGQNSTYVLEEIFEHENYSLDFWTNVSLEDNWQDVNVPAIHIGGWYDIFLQGTIDGYLGYQHLGGAGAIGKSKLIIGPWTHSGSITRRQGQLTYPFNSLDTFSLKMFRNMIRQFTMDDGTNDYDKWPTVSYYVMGDVEDIHSPGNEWRYADDWPIPYNDTYWYFHENGVLSIAFPENYDSITYVYDPEDPVPTVGGQNLNIPAGPFD